MGPAKRFAFVLAKETVLNAFKENDGGLALRWLKNRQRERYHEKVEQDVKQTTVEEVLQEVEKKIEYPELFEASSSKEQQETNPSNP